MTFTKGLLYVTLTLFTLMAVLVLFQTDIDSNSSNMQKEESSKSSFELPEPKLEGTMSLEEAIEKRRSVRDYSEEPLDIEAVSQILWASQGITDSDSRLRASPSAGALYPLSLYVVLEDIDGLDDGIYRYLVDDHALEMIKIGRFKVDIYESALRQPSVKDASILIVIAANYSITETRYGDRAERYANMEAGHVGQNIYLQATAMDLGTVAIGAFDYSKVKDIVNGSDNDEPIYLFPVGRR